MTLIENQSAFDEACLALSASPWLAIDTEADSLHHYTEKLCLVQISGESGDFVIDTLCGIDLTKLAKILQSKYLLLHGADFDLRMLKKHIDFIPSKIFDTMIAAQLLGYDKQGLADLALRHCGVTLSKDNQKADWSLRPLDEDLLTYASNDTHYLKTIHDLMVSELEALGRLEWQRQSCERLIKTATTPREKKVAEENQWQIKGSKELKGKSLTHLKFLWQWREAEAKRRDRPSFKILNSDTLLEIAQWADKHPGQDIELMPKAPRNVRGDLRALFNRLLAEAATLPQAEFFQAPRGPHSKKKWGDKEEKQLTDLKAERQRIAAELKIQPSLLATNAVLETLILEKPENAAKVLESELLMPWQAEIIWDGFSKILNS